MRVRVSPLSLFFKNIFKENYVFKILYGALAQLVKQRLRIPPFPKKISGFKSQTYRFVAFLVQYRPGLEEVQVLLAHIGLVFNWLDKTRQYMSVHKYITDQICGCNPNW